MSNDYETKMRYQTEAPSNEDIFKGGGHLQSALAIRQALLEHKDIHLIGLEGALGAGKSTVLKLLQSELKKDDYNFIFFDVDQYHYGNTKAAFVKIFSEKLKAILSDKMHEDIDEACNKALGNTLEYKKRTNSSITPIVIVFSISILFCVRYLPESISNITDAIINLISGNNTSKFSLEKTTTSLLGTSPFLVYFAKTILDKFSKKTVLGLGDLLKKNSIDKIKETMEVTREVGSVELREAFTSFSSAITSDKKKIILVIDNLDRLDTDKTKEVWSDLEIFTSIKSENLRIILPYSQYHVAKSLKDEDIKSGHEYISKKLPVVFRAPPIVRTGWREQFKNHYWAQTLPQVDEADICCQLIDIWESSESQITPRFLKKHVNDIATLRASNPNHDISAACCSAYLLATKIHQVSIEQLLTANLNAEDEKNRRLRATHQQLRKLMDDDEWTKTIACLHYQTSSDIAQSELLDEPIKAAINTYDGVHILELSSLYGFDDAFERYIQTIDSTETIKLASEVLSIGDKEQSNIWITRWLDEINKLTKLTIGAIKYDQDYVDAIKNLTKNGYKVDLSLIKSSSLALNNEIISDDNNRQEKIKSLYQYSTITGKLPTIVTNPNDIIITYYLWPLRHYLDEWNIEDIRINKNVRIDIIKEATENFEPESIDMVSLFDWLNTTHKIGLISQLSDKNASPNKSYSPSTNNIKLSEYSILPYSKEFYEAQITSSIMNALVRADDESEEEITSHWIALLLAHLITVQRISTNVNYINTSGQNISTNTLSFVIDYMNKYSNYSEYLTNYLSFIPSFSELNSAILNEHLSPYLKDSVNTLIKNMRVSVMHHNYMATNQYPVISTLLDGESKKTLIETVLNMQGFNECPTNWSMEFLSDSIDNECNSAIKYIQSRIDNNSFEFDFWTAQLNSPSDNVKYIIDWYNSLKRKIISSKNLSESLSVIIQNKDDSARQTYNQSDFISKIMSVLPSEFRDNVKRKMQNRFVEETSSNIERISTIRNFGSFIELPKIKSEFGKTIYINLIQETENEDILKWLDSQNWHLEEWDSNLIKQLANVIELKSEICELPYINNKINSLKTKETAI